VLRRPPVAHVVEGLRDGRKLTEMDRSCYIFGTMNSDDLASGAATAATDSEKPAAIQACLEALFERYNDPELRFQEINDALVAYSKLYPPETFPLLLEKKALELALAQFPNLYQQRRRLIQIELALEQQWPLYAYRSRVDAVDEAAVALDGIEAPILAMSEPANRFAHAVVAFARYVQIGRPERYPAALQDFALNYLGAAAVPSVQMSAKRAAAAGRIGTLDHFVVTRFGLGVRQQSWYDGILDLFEAVTFPSMRGQTSQEFTWLVVVDSHMPDAARLRLEDIVADMPNLHVIPLDMTACRHMRHGSFEHVWDACQDYVLEQRLVTDPTDYVITSSIDSDDALHPEAMGLVRCQLQSELARLRNSEFGRAAVFRHTGGLVLTLPRGLRWFVESDIVQSYDYPFLGMGMFVLARFSSGISVLSCNHSHWPAMANVLDFDLKYAELGRAMWVYVRHKRTQVDWKVKVAERDPDSAAVLRGDFLIDFEKIRQWREDSARQMAQTRVDGHDGMSSREQYDCCFLLNALNRQIAALERKRGQRGTDDGDELLMMQQREERLRLLNRFEQGAFQLFS
jgi:Putative rhamnosyl transferase